MSFPAEGITTEKYSFFEKIAIILFAEASGLYHFRRKIMFWFYEIQKY